MRSFAFLALAGLASHAVWVDKFGLRIEKENSALHGNSSAADTLFTCTTFLTLPHKLQELTEALRSVQKHAMHSRIARYVIFNEYDPSTDAEPTLNMLREKFPAFEFVQKEKAEQGQAKSLNMAIDMVESGQYKYWIKWEESWKVDYDFLDSVYDIMDGSSLGRIGLTESLKYENFFDKEDRGNFVVWSVPKQADLSLYEFEDRMEKSIKCDAYNWPNWSLRPSFERASSISSANFRFNEDSASWPWPFEFEFSAKWMLNNKGEGAKCGLLKRCPVSRVSGHESTYNEKLP